MKKMHGDRAKYLLKNAIKLLRLLKISHETILKELEMSEKEIKQLMKE